ncbi:hypothetical protein KAR91_36245 [Candidatus Pacearchaeota archaeon]|nr:hypothetical protein [Candidatus Pacearchaeota archaeon]
MKTIITLIILLISTTAYSFCNYYFYKTQYMPSYKNYKVCIYTKPSELDIHLKHNRFAACPMFIQYDDYNGFICE